MGAADRSVDAAVLSMRTALPRLAALAVFGAAVAIVGFRHRDLMGPDAIAYLRNARYLTEGRFADSVSGVWSPLVSWCVAPWIAAGFDGLHALYGVLAAWGAILLVFAGVLVRRVTDLSPAWTFVLLLLVADATLKWAATSWPDVILAACLTAAAAAVAHERFVESRWLQVQCGLWGGLAYLGKAYGLPYFMLFLPLSVAILHGSRAGWRAAGGRRRLAAAWMTSALVALALSAPWIAALSVKFGRPTYGLAGALNHAIVGPEEAPRNELWKPVEGRVTVWEIPETRRYRTWSPFDSVAHFDHQVTHTWRTAKGIRDSVARFDYLAWSLGLVAVAPFLLLALGEREACVRAWWLLAAAAAFCAPLALVNYEYRYVTPFLKPWCLIGCFHLAAVVGRRLSRSGRAALAGAVALSFAAHVNVPFHPYTYQNPDGSAFDDVVVDTRIHREVARALLAQGVPGPFASTRYWGGMFTAYFADRPFVGTPLGATAQACDAEMSAVGVRGFLMDPDWRFAEAFLADPHWTRRGTVDVGEGRAMLVLTRETP